DKHIELRETASQKQLGRIPFPGRDSAMDAVSFSADAKLLAAALEGELHIWEVPSGKALHRLKGPARSPWAVLFSPDAKTISWVAERAVYSWQLPAGTALPACPAATTRPDAPPVYTPDGQKFLTLRGDGVVVWDVRTGKELRSWPRGGKRPDDNY